MKAKYIVEVVLPEGINRNDFREYMREAIEHWAGGGCPDNPLFTWFFDKKERLTIKHLKRQADE